MTDLLKDLTERALGLAPRVEPVLTPLFGKGREGDAAVLVNASDAAVLVNASDAASDRLHPVDSGGTAPALEATSGPVGNPDGQVPEDSGLSGTADRPHQEGGIGLCVSTPRSPALATRIHRDSEVSRPAEERGRVDLRLADTSSDEALPISPRGPGSMHEPGDATTSDHVTGRGLATASMSREERAGGIESLVSPGLTVNVNRDVIRSSDAGSTRHEYVGRVLQEKLPEPLLMPVSSASPRSPGATIKADNARLEADGKAENNERPIVRVTIGRIEVEATPPPAIPPMPRVASGTPAMALQEYLRKDRRRQQ